jgi:carboxymethylenebutenolidase
MRYKILAGIGLLLAVIVALAITKFRPENNSSSNSQPSVTNVQVIDAQHPADVTVSEPMYFANTKGFLAKPKQAGTYPGIIMIHEWWGLNQNVKDMAQKLATQGYTVLAVDLYGGKVAKTPEEAQKYVADLDQPKALDNMKAAFDYLKTQGATRIGSWGWCFGGGQSMQLALSGLQLDATVIYYGNLVTDKTKLSAIKWPVLGVFGDKDQTIKVESVKQFQTSLDALKIQNEIEIYPGVGHAFANPSGASYAPKETQDAWDKTLSFLNKYLRVNTVGS